MSDTTDAQPDRGQRPIGSPDGFGWYGILTETPAGLLCAECGWEGTHLGLHAYKAHGLPAVRYKRLHGLRLSQGLIVAEVKHRMSQIRTENPNPYLAAARDPAAATAARLAQGSPISPAGDAARTANLDRTREQRRHGHVIECAECGNAFCPLTNAARRRFCSRSCASRHNRRQQAMRSQSPSIDPTSAGVHPPAGT